MKPANHVGRTVLIHHPQAGVSARIHALLEGGARISVLTSNPDASLRDLASRKLIELVTEADPWSFDQVVRDAENPIPTPSSSKPMPAGAVTLVGGGPGDEGLLTVAGLAAIQQADVLICDRLAPLGALQMARPEAEVIHVGKIPRGEFTPQETINALLVQHATAGRNVVRLKGGDNFVFGRGGEEWNACVAAGIDVRVIPGVSSVMAAPALAGIPITHRGVTSGFVVVSGHVGPDDPRSDVNWSALATAGLTIVVLMGVGTLAGIAERLVMEGLEAETHAACIADASMPSQRSVRGTLADIALRAEEAGVSAPAVTVIGRAVEALHR